MITFTKAFQTSSGKTYASLEEAQRDEIFQLLFPVAANADDRQEEDEIVKRMVDHKEAIINILTTTPNSHPRGRSANGAKRTRKPKALPELVNNREP